MIGIATPHSLATRRSLLCPHAVCPGAGEEWRGRPQLKATVRVFNTAFFRKVITKHDTGMGESYMDGDYEVPTLRS